MAKYTCTEMSTSFVEQGGIQNGNSSLIWGHQRS